MFGISDVEAVEVVCVSDVLEVVVFADLLLSLVIKISSVVDSDVFVVVELDVDVDVEFVELDEFVSVDLLDSFWSLEVFSWVEPLSTVVVTVVSLFVLVREVFLVATIMIATTRIKIIMTVMVATAIILRRSFFSASP